MATSKPSAAKGLLGRLNEVLHEAAAAVLRAWGFEEMRDLTTDADHPAPPVGSFNPDEWEPHIHRSEVTGQATGKIELRRKDDAGRLA